MKFAKVTNPKTDKNELIEGSAAEEASESAAEEKNEKDPEPYEIESAANHLMEAEKVKANPKLMKHVAYHLSQKQQAMKKISSLKELKAVAKKKIAKEGY